MHSLVRWINKGFCIDNRQSSMSGEGLQCGSEAATCNQGRSESLQGNCRDLPIPDGVVLALVVARGCQPLPQTLTATVPKTAELTYRGTSTATRRGLQIKHSFPAWRSDILNFWKTRFYVQVIISHCPNKNLIWISKVRHFCYKLHS